MTMGLLDGELAQIVGEAFDEAGIFWDASLSRETAGAGPEWNPGSPTSVNYSCKAITDTYSERLRAEGLIKADEVKVLILATSLSVEPKPADKVTIRGETYTVLEVSTDPAKAVWVCKAKK